MQYSLLAQTRSVELPMKKLLERTDFWLIHLQTWATCVIFILNMVLHPEIQDKARRQLDSIVGSDRLPDFSDRASMPYLEHIVQEVYRYVAIFFWCFGSC